MRDNHFYMRRAVQRLNVERRLAAGALRRMSTTLIDLTTTLQRFNVEVRLLNARSQERLIRHATRIANRLTRGQKIRERHANQLNAMLSRTIRRTT